ncbi:MAG: hypothetical protein BWY74_00340 [Firmicutes bacterium ADurb.Bin419]|nr:MAG: hypothetical protein BWY74_00340 [Firmicutes bacterium ADurb.Bin419]
MKYLRLIDDKIYVFGDDDRIIIGANYKDYLPLPLLNYKCDLDILSKLFLSEAGRRGGNKTREKGSDYYKKLSKLGVNARKNKKLSTINNTK